MRTSKLLALALLAAACGGPKTPDPVPAPLPDPASTPAPDPAPSPTPAPKPDDTSLVQEAKQFIADADKELRKLVVEASVADWANQTDITPEHEAATAKAGEAYANGLSRLIKASRKYEPVLGKLDPDTRRMFHLLKFQGQPAPDDPKESEELAKIAAEMSSIYGKGKACDTSKPKAGAPKQADLDTLDAKLANEKDAKAKAKLVKNREALGKKFEVAYCKDLDALEKTLEKSRKPAELLAAWQGWHDSVGKAVRPLYTRYVELANKGARAVGFRDVADMWRGNYDMPEAQVEPEIDRVWNQVKPLYSQLHCYARRGLNKKYGDKVVPRTGPIPVHVTGNMWGQRWENLYADLEPFKGVSPIDATPALQKKYDSRKMVKVAEAFFVSLGLNPLPATFWERSLFDKPRGKEVVCHPSAWDVTYANDLRLKMCINKTHADLVVVHHELGHHYYFNNYYQLPMLFQQGANDGFHEAIGDAAALSMTPVYLKKVGLVDKVVKNDKATINQQMHVALDKLAMLPWTLLVDKWRWDVFSGKVKPEQFNTRWWQLKLEYQGLTPGVPRTEAEFDPGAKYHIPGNTSYLRYFIAHVLQFQLQRAMCKKAGHTGPLHECSVYQNKEAGAALAKLLKLGASKPWQDALFEMSGERDLDATALLEYFAPLAKWLEEQNKGQQCGW